jgi:hypothetical protein
MVASENFCRSESILLDNFENPLKAGALASDRLLNVVEKGRSTFFSRTPLEKKPASAEANITLISVHLSHAGVVLSEVLWLSGLGFIAVPFSIIGKIRS